MFIVDIIVDGFTIPYFLYTKETLSILNVVNKTILAGRSLSFSSFCDFAGRGKANGRISQ